MSEDIHRGHILRKVICDKGIKISQLARSIGRSRRFIYIMFDKEDVPLHYMREIGTVINHDFFQETNNNNADTPHLYQKEGYWKDKYLLLLEEHNNLLKIHYEQH